MNSMNHALIGTVVYEYIKGKYGIELDKESFIKGNTCPDHSLAFLRPHRLRFCGKAVRKKTVRLCRTAQGEISARDSKKIGILCHYYCDFLCRPHNPRFGWNLKKHVRYEDELLDCMKSHLNEFLNTDYIIAPSIPFGPVEINRRMNYLVHERPVLWGDYEEELLRAVEACAQLVLWVSGVILMLDGVPLLPPVSLPA